MIEGYSKFNRNDKIELLGLNEESKNVIFSSVIKSPEIASIVDELSENTVAHFPFPFGIVPNVLINNETYFIPLVTEESSVVAAIAKAAKIWSKLGGFKTSIKGTLKKGQVHFFWKGSAELLHKKFNSLKEFIELRVSPLNRNMKKRNAGIQDIKLIDKTHELEFYYQIDVSFETADAMGANYINSCLEEIAKALEQFFKCEQNLDANLLEVNMAILSNYTPECVAVAKTECSLEEINSYGKKIGVENYAQKFVNAIKIASIDVNRAVTHNKGIYNGIDSLAIATGNDWRAIEACGHAYASKDGSYKSLSTAWISENTFTFQLHLPLAVGTVGGVTNLHPLSKLSLEILKKPSAEKLMQIIATVGLAANFSAINALISSGIQKGHMKMHLTNILSQFNPTEKQITEAKEYFKDKIISHHAVENWLKQNE